MTTAPDVIIIGAGLAGLVSAYELSRVGYKVVLLEAQDRPGGRVKTLRTGFSTGLYADVGARFIPDSHKMVLSYASEFQLPIASLPHHTRFRYYLHGMDKSIGVNFEKPWRHPIPLDLSEDERTAGVDNIFSQCLQPAFAELGDPTAANWPPPALNEYDVGLLTYLTDRPTRPSDGAIELVRPFFWWGSRDDLDSVSALWMMRQLAIGFHYEKHLYTISGGMDALPLAFAKRLIGKISYNSPVTAIQQETQSVKVVYRKAGKKHSISAGRVVCAIPFSTLREIKIEPTFSTEKRQVIEELPYASVARVCLQCKRRCWQQSMATLTNLPIHNLLEATAIQKGARKILDSYMSSASARTLMGLKKNDRVDYVLEQVQLVYPDIIFSFERGQDVCWDEDPWARGAYPFIRPTQMFKFTRDLIARPEGRVHFAGDHASSRPGWMEGALESGHRAACEIIHR